MSERTYQALLDRIAARQIGSGEVLEERRLAEELNVSRTPMRAALNRLLGEGILKRLSNGSVVVHAFGVTELLELLQIRQLLEGQAAAMAAGRIPGDKLAAVKARLEDVMRYSAAGGESTWTADNEVHELVAAYCGNKSMAAMIADAARAPVQRRAPVAARGAGAGRASGHRAGAAGRRRRTGARDHDGAPGRRAARSRARWGICRMKTDAARLARCIVAEPLTSQAFAEFGEVVEHAGNERRRHLALPYAHSAPAARTAIWVSRVDGAIPQTCPVLLLERHPYSSQTFIPLDNTPISSSWRRTMRRASRTWNGCAPSSPAAARACAIGLASGTRACRRCARRPSSP